MLSKIFPKETITYYSGNPLNRLSYLRDDSDFLTQSLKHPSTRFVAFYRQNPKVKKATKGWEFDYLSYSQVEPVLSSSVHIFLGADPSQEGLNHPRGAGVGYWAINLAQVPEKEQEDFRSVKFGARLDRRSAAIFAQASHTLDWINRNKFCAACGHKTGPDLAGYHMICSNAECSTKQGISNVCFPRTDNSIIVAVLDHKGENILLGRGKRFPPGMYSCLAGFLEPGESVEDCVRREVLEEAGVKVGHVSIHSSQPWPYPANIMLGCLAQIADDSPESHKIHLDHDPELADAQWVPVKRVAEMCASKKFEGEMFIPPPDSIAWVLLDTLSKLETGRL